MDEKRISIFISCVREYFMKVTNHPVEVGVPFLESESESFLLGYTGVIGISGKLKGAVYITAGRKLMRDLISFIMPGRNIIEADISNMVGELANTIAGNAQKVLGPEFHISVPIILTRDKTNVSGSIIIKAPTFVLPLKWMESVAYLAVGILTNE